MPIPIGIPGAPTPAQGGSFMGLLPIIAQGLLQGDPATIQRMARAGIVPDQRPGTAAVLEGQGNPPSNPLGNLMLAGQALQGVQPPPQAAPNAPGASFIQNNGPGNLTAQGIQQLLAGAQQQGVPGLRLGQLIRGG